MKTQINLENIILREKGPVKKRVNILIPLHKVPRIVNFIEMESRINNRLRLVDLFKDWE